MCAVAFFHVECFQMHIIVIDMGTELVHLKNLCLQMTVEDIDVCLAETECDIRNQFSINLEHIGGLQTACV